MWLIDQMLENWYICDLGNNLSYQGTLLCLKCVTFISECNVADSSYNNENALSK